MLARGFGGDEVRTRLPWQGLQEGGDPQALVEVLLDVGAQERRAERLRFRGRYGRERVEARTIAVSSRAGRTHEDCDHELAHEPSRLQRMGFQPGAERKDQGVKLP